MFNFVHFSHSSSGLQYQVVSLKSPLAAAKGKTTTIQTDIFLDDELRLFVLSYVIISIS